MKTFKNGPIGDWHEYQAGRTIEFFADRPRHVKFQVVANSPVEVWVSESKDMANAKLVGVSSDKMQVEYTAQSTTYSVVKAQKGAAVFLNVRDLDQRIVESDNPSFTNIEPRVSNTSEFDKMVKWVELNQRMRDEQMRAERQEFVKKLAAAKAEAVVEAEPVVEEAEVDEAVE